MNWARLRNLVLMFLCLLRFIFRGRSNRAVENPKKVLIVQLAKLGDMICTTPLFRAVKRKYPRAFVYVIGRAENAEVLADNTDIDSYIVCGRRWSVDVLRRLYGDQIDFACVAGPNFYALAMLYLSGIPSIAVPVVENGYCPYESRLYKILRKLVIRRPHRMGHYAPREYLRLLEPIGVVTDDTTKHLSFSREAADTIAKFLDDNHLDPEKDFLVGISPSAGNKIKEWQRSKFATVADYLYKRYHAKIFVTGGAQNKLEAEEMLRHLDAGTKVIDTTGIFSVDEFKAFMSTIHLCISVDSGPIYIAEALGIPTLDIVGPIDDREQPPKGRLNRVVKLADRGRPELHVMNARVFDEREAKRQIEAITPDMVIKELDRLVDELRQK